MAPSVLHCVSALLCLASLALLATDASQAESYSADPASTRSAASSASLGHILRRRSAEMQAPPNYYESRLASYLRPVQAKRDDGYWIWMPAHGYMSVPRDEVPASSGDKDSMGNLLRYGK